MDHQTPEQAVLGVACQLDDRGVCTVLLNRPQLHNAFDDQLIADLRAIFDHLSSDPDVRVVVLRGAGKSFSAGADLAWMQRMATYSEEENHADALALAEMLASIATCHKPVIAAVHGAAFGGGVGLVAACDMALASTTASFCLSEVKLGLIPATIAPYVTAAIGVRASRRYMLTAERFEAAEALRLGLVHQLAAPEDFEQALEKLIAALLVAGPQAVAATKDLISAVAYQPLSEALKADTAARIARQRVSAEGQDGLQAFLSKRAPGWVKGLADV